MTTKTKKQKTAPTSAHVALTSPGGDLPSLNAPEPVIPTASASQESSASVPATNPTTAVPAAPSITLDVAAGPPDVTFPSVPDGFVMPSMRLFKGIYPSKSELSALPMVLQDLGNFTSYGAALGSAAPDEATLAADLAVGLRWRASRNAAEIWTDYVKVADAMAWQAVAPALDELRPLFLLAAKKDGTLLTKYRGLAAYFNAGTSRGLQAAATKKKKAKAKAAAANAAATSAPPTSPKVTAGS